MLWTCFGRGRREGWIGDVAEVHVEAGVSIWLDWLFWESRVLEAEMEGVFVVVLSRLPNRRYDYS